MTSAARKHFEVRSARNAEFFRSDRPWAAISITSGPAHRVLSEANRVGLLRLVFDDITQPDTPQSFTPALAAEILDFVASVWDQAEAFLIHCDVGVEIPGRRGGAVPHLLRRRWTVVRAGFSKPPGLRRTRGNALPEVGGSIRMSTTEDASATALRVHRGCVAWRRSCRPRKCSQPRTFPRARVAGASRGQSPS